MNPEELGLQISELVAPFIGMMMVIIVAMLVKDVAGDVAKGLSFKYFGPFKEGDQCVLDGHRAVIVKMGMMSTVFGYNDPKKGYVWRYVSNDRIGNLQLGKVISPQTKKI